MYLEVKAGDHVWEDYYRDRHGIVQEVFKGKKGAVYAKVLWDGLPDALGNIGAPVLAAQVNARNLRSTRKPEFMSEAERSAMLTIPAPPAFEHRGEYNLTESELHIIVAALKSYPVRPQIRQKIGQLLERLEA
jgi:hypothetical protein